MPPNKVSNKAPLCSVIVPAFNAAGTILRAIGSVLAQTTPDFELIIVDDGSTDGTGAIMRQGARDPRVRLITLPCNTGAAAARNTALDVARGRFIAFLDADDEWLPQKLETQISKMTQTGAELCYSSFQRRSRFGDKTVHIPNRVTYEDLLRGNVIGCLTAIYDTQRLGKIPMPQVQLRHDYALWLTILKRTPVAVGVDEILAIHHRQARSLSSNIFAGAKATYDVFHAAERLSRLQSIRHLGAHYYNRLQSIR